MALTLLHTPFEYDWKTFVGASGYRTVFELFVNENAFHYSDPDSLLIPMNGIS